MRDARARLSFPLCQPQKAPCVRVLFKSPAVNTLNNCDIDELKTKWRVCTGGQTIINTFIEKLSSKHFSVLIKRKKAFVINDR